MKTILGMTPVAAENSVLTEGHVQVDGQRHVRVEDRRVDQAEDQRVDKTEGPTADKTIARILEIQQELTAQVEIELNLDRIHADLVQRALLRTHKLKHKTRNLSSRRKAAGRAGCELIQKAFECQPVEPEIKQIEPG